jgi:hypothetical protein
LGVIVGAMLGAIGGASAWFSLEAQSMMLPIVLGSTIKGVVTGWPRTNGWLKMRAGALPKS